jgi:hypothetical protein
VLVILLLVAGALISGFSILRDIDPFDEGLALQAARRIAVGGQVPYRDFQWAYGPAQPYLLAGLFKLFGVSLLQWRIVRSLCDAAIALTAYVLVADRAPRPIALASWLAVICEMAEPRSADPFPPALLAVLLALRLVTPAAPAALTRGRVIGAALLTAAAAAFRLDFALYGGAAVVIALAASGALRGAGRREWLGQVTRYVIVSVVVGAVIYAPFAIADGVGNLYQALVGTSLRTGGNWTLPFPWHFHTPAGAGLAKTLKKALDFYVPVIVLVGFALAALAALVTAVRGWRARRPSSGPLPVAARQCGLAVLGVGLLAYLLSRTDEFHVQPLFVVAAIVLGLMAGAAPRPVALVGGLLLALLLVHGVANRVSALTKPPHEQRLKIAVGDGVTAPPREARAIDQMVRLVDSHTRRNQPIYVLPRRSDLVRIADPLIYVMTQRNNPTRQDFGLLTGAAAQRRIVATLTRVRPRVIVRWTDPTSSAREPNSRGRSSGVHTVDRWVAAHYRLLRRLYHYDVLVAKGAPPRRARS